MTDGLYAIPEKLDPFPDESMASLAMRYAALHGFPTPERLFDRLALKRRAFPTLMALEPASMEGAAVAALLNLSPHQTSIMSNWHAEPKSVSVGGHRIFTDLTDIHSRQCCPSCLVQAPYHRSFWLMAAIPVCHIHGTFLEQRCPRCATTLTWRGLGPQCCANPACCFDLREAEPVAAPEASRLASAGLHGIYSGKAHPSGLTLDDAMLATLAIGRLLLGSRVAGRSRLSAFIRREREKLAGVLAAGWVALDPWPAAYHTFLAGQVEAHRTEEVIPGLKAAFGQFHRMLKHRRGWQRHLGDELNRFALGRTDIAVRTGRLVAMASRHDTANNRLSLAEVGQALGVSHTAAARIAEGFGGKRSESRRSGKVLVDAAAVAALAQVREAGGETVSTTQAANLLGITSVTLRRLVADGHVAEVPVAQRVKVNESFQRADVVAILTTFERAAAGVPVVDQPAARHRRSRRGGNRDGFGSRAIVAGVLGGTLAPVAVWSGGQGIGRYMFEKPGTPGSEIDSL